MKKYDKNKFYQELKVKFSENEPKKTINFMLEEFTKAVKLADEDSIIFIGNELASFLRVQGNTEYAYKIYLIISEITISKYGSNSKEYATLLLNLADVDIVDKNYDKAVQRLNKSYQILKLYPEEKYLLATLYNNRSFSYKGLAKYKEAEEDILSALFLIENDSKRAISLINLAEIKLAQNKLDEALEAIDKSINYYQVENIYDIHYANALATKGQIFYYKKDYENSLCYYKKAQQEFMNKVGPCRMTKLLENNIETIEHEMRQR